MVKFYFYKNIHKDGTKQNHVLNHIHYNLLNPIYIKIQLNMKLHNIQYGTSSDKAAIIFDSRTDTEARTHAFFKIRY